MLERCLRGVVDLPMIAASCRSYKSQAISHNSIIQSGSLTSACGVGLRDVGLGVLAREFRGVIRGGFVAVASSSSVAESIQMFSLRSESPLSKDDIIPKALTVRRLVVRLGCRARPIPNVNK